MGKTSKFVTKTDLKRTEVKLGKAIEGNRKEILNFKWEIDKKLLAYQEKTEKMITSFKDAILGAIHKVMKELVTIREEQIIIGHQVSRHEEKLEDHEERLTHLETPFSTN